MLSGGPRSCSSSRTLSTFSVSFSPMPRYPNECGVQQRLSFTTGAPPEAADATGKSWVAAGPWSNSPSVRRDINPRRTSEAMPAIMPLWIECGTRVMVRKQGIATRRLSHAMLRLGSIMKAPMRISGAAAAMSGTDASRGVVNADIKKSSEVTTEDMPVRAPSMIPALLSLAMISGPTPRSAATIVAMPTLACCRLLSGTLPLLRRPPMLYKPYCTPVMSKIAMKSMARVPSIKGPTVCFLNQPEKSRVSTVSNDGDAKIWSGGLKMPQTQLPMAIREMLSSRAPSTRTLTRMAETMQKTAMER
mmetsp:Transcript_33743/g.100202  ORF Transcript_33743/g.100202 Transcript_33743/m.100202 type:complete len:304 (+) Transcript_33743:149-1060(+)